MAALVGLDEARRRSTLPKAVFDALLLLSAQRYEMAAVKFEAWAAAATDRAAPGDSECAGEHRAPAGAPLFAYDPAESYEADHFGSAQVDNGGEPLFVTKKITPEV